MYWILDSRYWNRALSIVIGLLSFLLMASFTGCGEDEDDEVAQAPRAAYIVNGLAETMSVFDIETSEVTNDILTVGKWPNDIKIWEDEAYIVNTGDNNIQIISLESLTEVGLIDAGDSAGPEKVDFLNGERAYVSCLNINSVKVVDLAARQITKTIEVGVGPWGVAVAGQKVYVCNPAYDFATNSYGDGTVSVINSSTDTVVKTINVEPNPTEIVASGTQVLVLCTGNYADVLGNLCVIDTTSDTVVKTIDLGTIPSNIAVSPNGTAYVTASEGLLPVDIDSGSVATVLTDFAGGSGLAFDSDGNGYVTIPDWTGGAGDKLLVMDTSENLVGAYSVGGGASIIAVRE